MKRQMFFATAFSAALAIGVAAQTPTTGQAGAQPQQKSEQQTVTVTGCLQQGTQAGGQTGTPATGAPATGAQAQRAEGADSGFILTNAQMGSGATAGTGTATGTATEGTAGTRAGAANRFRLTGGDQEDLRKYVNSRVEIRGTFDTARSGAATGTATGETGAAAGQKTGEDRSMRTLRVTSVRQIAEKCAER